LWYRRKTKRKSSRIVLSISLCVSVSVLIRASVPLPWPAFKMKFYECRSTGTINVVYVPVRLGILFVLFSSNIKTDFYCSSL
jgi:hypothetical protein